MCCAHNTVRDSELRFLWVAKQCWVGNLLWTIWSAPWYYKLDPLVIWWFFFAEWPPVWQRYSKREMSGGSEKRTRPDWFDGAKLWKRKWWDLLWCHNNLLAGQDVRRKFWLTCSLWNLLKNMLVSTYRSLLPRLVLHIFKKRKLWCLLERGIVTSVSVMIGDNCLMVWLQSQATDSNCCIHKQSWLHAQANSGSYRGRGFSRVR